MKTINKLKKIVILLFTTIILSSCSLPGLGGGLDGEGITITGGTTSETQILAFIVEGMVEHYLDIDAGIINNLGSSTLNHQALIGGDANVSGARYTGTSLTGELALDPITDPIKAFDTVVEGFETEFDQKWFPSYGFSNSYAFMVTKDTSEKYGLKTISDLKDIISELNLGADTSWMERKGDGYDAFVSTYGFDFNRVYPMQIGLVYDALAADKMDVVLGYSTDGRIKSYDLVVLEDDKQLFPPYDASPVASNQILMDYPELNEILLILEGTISTEKMQEMNFSADNDLLEPKTVAQNFLNENNFFEDKKGAE